MPRAGRPGEDLAIVGVDRGIIRRHHDALGEKRPVVAAIVPAQRIGRGASLAINGGVGVDCFDQPLPDLRVIDDELAVAGDVVRSVGIDELNPLRQPATAFPVPLQAQALDGQPKPPS
jgi:hypothetical protein